MEPCKKSAKPDAETGASKILPFLRWAGSKRKLIPRLAPYWGIGHSRYVEPFMGSASLFFFLAPKQALLGDLNADLVETFVNVRDDPRAVHKALSSIRLGKRSYNKIRRVDTGTLNSLERAARFVFLHRFETEKYSLP